MSATYSNGIITQTGTDTNPTVFSGLTGVSITGTSEYKVVLFDGVKLIVNGTLSMPKYYRLYFINTSTVDFKINGTVNVDYFTITAAGTVYHTTPWVEFGRQSTNSAGQECLQVSGSGTLNWRGGSILADPVVRLSSGATVLFNNSVIDSTNANMFRIFTSNLTFEGPLINIGKRTTINSSGITLDNYSPKGGGGLDHGGSNTDFTLNNFSPEANSRDSALRFNNSDSVFNASTGMNLAVLPFHATGTHPHNGGAFRLYRKISTNIKDVNNNALQAVKTFLPSYDDSNRINLTSNFGSGWDFTSVTNTILTTAANGKSSIHNQILKVWYLITTNGNDLEVIRFDKNADDSGIFTATSYKYGYLIQSNDYNLNGLEDLELGISLLPDANIIESNKATVDAYTEIDTAAKFYDKASSYLEDNLGTYLDFIVTRSGDIIDAGAYNVTIDATASSAFDLTGNLITIKASTFTGDMVTAGLITLANGAIFDGVRTDANGTVHPDQPISITNISAGSRMRIYNVTTGVETVNTVVSGTSYTSSYQEGTGYNDGDTVRVYLTKLGKDEWVGDVIDTSNGFNVLTSQVDNDVYTALGIDGTTVTKFQADYVNNEVDLVIGADWTMAELYAWWANNLTTEDGIRNFFGGITAIDQANFRINTSIVDLYLDNTTNASYKQTDNRRFFRDTGTGYPVRNPTTSGYGLDVVWRNTILIAQTEAGGTSDLNFYDVKRAVKQVITNPKYIKGQK